MVRATRSPFVLVLVGLDNPPQLPLTSGQVKTPDVVHCTNRLDGLKPIVGGYGRVRGKAGGGLFDGDGNDVAVQKTIRDLE